MINWAAIARRAAEEGRLEVYLKDPRPLLLAEVKLLLVETSDELLCRAEPITTTLLWWAPANDQRGLPARGFAGWLDRKTKLGKSYIVVVAAAVAATGANLMIGGGAATRALFPAADAPERCRPRLSCRVSAHE